MNKSFILITFAVFLMGRSAKTKLTVTFEASLQDPIEDLDKTFRRANADHIKNMGGIDVIPTNIVPMAMLANHLDKIDKIFYDQFGQEFIDVSVFDYVMEDRYHFPRLKVDFEFKMKDDQADYDYILHEFYFIEDYGLIMIPNGTNTELVPMSLANKYLVDWKGVFAFIIMAINNDDDREIFKREIWSRLSDTQKKELLPLLEPKTMKVINLDGLSPEFKDRYKDVFAAANSVDHQKISIEEESEKDPLIDMLVKESKIIGTAGYYALPIKGKAKIYVMDLLKSFSEDDKSKIDSIGCKFEDDPKLLKELFPRIVRNDDMELIVVYNDGTDFEGILDFCITKARRLEEIVPTADTSTITAKTPALITPTNPLAEDTTTAQIPKATVPPKPPKSKAKSPITPKEPAITPVVPEVVAPLQAPVSNNESNNESNNASSNQPNTSNNPAATKSSCGSIIMDGLRWIWSGLRWIWRSITSIFGKILSICTG